MGKENTSALADKLEDAMISSIKQAYDMIKDGSNTLGELETKIAELLNHLNDKNETLGKLTKEGMKILLRVEKDSLQIRHSNKKAARGMETDG